VTEAEWLECADPLVLLEFLKGKATNRKLRLFAVGCCHLIWSNLTTHRSRRAVELAELYADGLASEADLHRARSMAIAAVREQMRVGSRRLVDDSVIERERRLYFPAEAAHIHDPFLIGRLRLVGSDPLLRPQSPALLRCIFGTPMQQFNIDHRWFTSTVVDLARTIYDDRAFDRMPILADALMDAGCDSEEIIDHCRGEGPHVRGCVVDLLTGRE
jgi:hypothetical protein